MSDSCRSIQALFPSLTPRVLDDLNPFAPLNCSSNPDALLGSVPPVCVASADSTSILYPSLPPAHPFDVCVEVEILGPSTLTCATIACGDLFHLLLLNPGIDCARLQPSQEVCVAGLYTGPLCATPHPPFTPPQPPPPPQVMTACNRGVQANTCGGGECIPGNRDGSPSNGNTPYHCSCPYPSRTRRQTDGLEICVNVRVCEQYAINPCLAGPCVDTLDGEYTCECAPGYFLGSNADATPVCRPNDAISLSAVDNVIRVPDNGATCERIALSNLLIVSQLQMLNPPLSDLCSNRSAIIKGGEVVTIGPVAGHTDCAILYTVATTGDTKEGVAALLSSEYGGVKVLVGDLDYLNPNLDSFAPNASLPGGDVMCVAGGNRALQPLCASYVIVQDGDSCASIIREYSILPLAFFYLNPGIDCSLVPHFAGLEVCVAPVSSGSSGNCGKYTSRTVPYTVKSGDSCEGIEGNYFTCSKAIMGCFNNGYQCKDPLKIGTKFNVPISLPYLTGLALYQCNNQRKATAS